MADENNSQVVEVSQETAENKEAMAEGETVEEIRTDTPTLPVALQIQKEVSSPLLADPYEFSQCTVTVVYTLLPDGNVSVSVHSHKDTPILKNFSETEVPLPERVSRVINTLREIWPGSEVSATFVLLPKGDDKERTVTISIRVNRDTPLVQSCLESELPFPAPILAMLEELKTLLPGRAMESIQKAAKSAKNIKRKPSIVNQPTKPVKTEPIPSPTLTPTSTQMNLF
jgi:hypothetical protein